MRTEVLALCQACFPGRECKAAWVIVGCAVFDARSSAGVFRAVKRLSHLKG